LSPTAHASIVRRPWFLLALAVVAADQATKLAAHRYLSDEGPVAVIPGLFNLWYSRNRGGLFGYFRDWGDPWRALLLTLLPAVAVILIAWVLARTAERDRVTLAGLSLILGGAIGNLIDRLSRGEVIDFLDVYAPPSRAAAWLESWFGTAHWPTFNLADSAIVIGASFLAWRIVRPHTEAAVARIVAEAAPPERV
jgi:signal peptidase II